MTTFYRINDHLVPYTGCEVEPLDFSRAEYAPLQRPDLDYKEPPAADPHAVLTVSVAVTRDMVAAAVEETRAQRDEPMADWSVQFIRETVAMHLTIVGELRLAEDAGYFATAIDSDPDTVAHTAAVYAVVDRAFPELAVKS